MSTTPNPVFSGLLQGFQLAHQMKQERLAQEAVARAERRDEENTQIRDLQTQMSLRSNGYEQSTPEQDAEIASGVTSGPTGLVPSDIKTRLAKFKGTTFVRKSKEQLTGEADQAAEASLGRKVKEAGALADVKGQSATKHAKEMLDTNGVAIDPEMAKTLHLQPGQKVLPEKIDDIMRGYSNAKAAERAATPHAVGAARQVTDDSGNVTSVQSYSDGTVKEIKLDAKGKKTKPAAAAGVVTPWQAARLKRQQKLDADKTAADHDKAQNTAQKEIDALNKQEQLLHAANREIGQRLIAGSAGTATNKKGAKIKVTAADADALKVQLADNQTKVKALQDRQHAVIMKFAGGAAVPANPY